RRFKETATVEHIAAHGDLHYAVGVAISLQRCLVAFGWRIGREVGVHQIAVLVDLERSLDRCAAAFDDDVLETGRLRLLHYIESGMGRLARQLDPARKDVVEFQRGQIGVDADPAVGSDLARYLDRNGAADRGTEIEAKPRAARVV